MGASTARSWGARGRPADRVRRTGVNPPGARAHDDAPSRVSNCRLTLPGEFSRTADGLGWAGAVPARKTWLGPAARPAGGCTRLEVERRTSHGVFSPGPFRRLPEQKGDQKSGRVHRHTVRFRVDRPGGSLSRKATREAVESTRTRCVPAWTALPAAWAERRPGKWSSSRAHGVFSQGPFRRPPEQEGDQKSGTLLADTAPERERQTPFFAEMARIVESSWIGRSGGMNHGEYLPKVYP